MTVRASENAKRAALLQLTQQAAEQIDRLLQPVGVAAQDLAGRLTRGEIAAAVSGGRAEADGERQRDLLRRNGGRPHGHDARTRLYSPYIEHNGVQAGAAPTIAKLVIRTRAVGVNCDAKDP